MTTHSAPQDAVTPEEPLRVCDLAPIGGRLGEAPEHFMVDERPLYEPSGSGEHWYVLLRKRGLTTPEMLRHVAKLAGVRERDIGYAGLKDKHAVTSQWVSLPSQAVSPEQWELPASIECLKVSRHNNKLRTGHLKGNVFKVTLVGVPAEVDERAHGIVARLAATGLPNYFGEQRFGHGGGNLAQALSWLSSTPRMHRKKARFYEKLYPSVLQAEVFNRYLSLRHQRGLERLLSGEVVRLNGSQSVFVVENPATEQPRFESGDILPTGPMFGPRAVSGDSVAGELESAAIQSLGLTSEQKDRLGKHARGTRRDLILPLEKLTLSRVDDSSLQFSFELPAGSYATQLIRELTGSPWLAVRSTNSSPAAIAGST